MKAILYFAFAYALLLAIGACTALVIVAGASENIVPAMQSIAQALGG